MGNSAAAGSLPAHRQARPSRETWGVIHRPNKPCLAVREASPSLLPQADSACARKLRPREWTGASLFSRRSKRVGCDGRPAPPAWFHWSPVGWRRSEEHTSELQSQSNIVCRLLLEKKKNTGREPIVWEDTRQGVCAAAGTRNQIGYIPLTVALCVPFRLDKDRIQVDRVARNANAAI